MTNVQTQHPGTHAPTSLDYELPEPVEPEAQKDPLACEFCGKVSGGGQGKAAHERFCRENPNRQVSKLELAELRRANNPDNLCPECEKAGTPRGFDTPGSLNAHLARSHGIRASGRPRRKKKKATSQPATAPAARTTETNEIRKSIKAVDTLKNVVRSMYPEGIPAAKLDDALPFILETHKLLLK